MKSFWYVLIILWGSPSQLGIGLLFRWSCTTCSNPSLDHIVLAQPGLLPPLCSTGVQILIREDLTRISQHWWFLKASMQQQIPTPNDTMRSQETPTVCYWWCKWLWNWGTTNSSGFSSFASFKLLFGDIPVYVYIYVYIPYIHPYIYIIYTHPYIYIYPIYIYTHIPQFSDGDPIFGTPGAPTFQRSQDQSGQCSTSAEKTNHQAAHDSIFSLIVGKTMVNSG